MWQENGKNTQNVQEKHANSLCLSEFDNPEKALFYFILFQIDFFSQIPSHLDKDLKEHLILRESGKLTNGKTLSVIRTLKQNLSPQEKGEIGKLISTAHNEEAKLKGTLDASEKISIHLRVTCDFIQNRRRRALVNFR